MVETNRQHRIVELCRHGERPFVTTNDIKHEFEISQQAAHSQLQQLVDDGVLLREKIGAGGVVWWPTSVSQSQESGSASC